MNATRPVIFLLLFALSSACEKKSSDDPGIEQMRRDIHQDAADSHQPSTSEDRRIIALHWKYLKICSERPRFQYGVEDLAYMRSYLDSLMVYLKSGPASDYQTGFYNYYFHHAVELNYFLNGSNAALAFAQSYSAYSPETDATELLKKAVSYVSSMDKLMKALNISVPLQPRHQDNKYRP